MEIVIIYNKVFFFITQEYKEHYQFHSKWWAESFAGHSCMHSLTPDLLSFHCGPDSEPGLSPSIPGTLRWKTVYILQWAPHAVGKMQRLSSKVGHRWGEGQGCGEIMGSFLAWFQRYSQKMHQYPSHTCDIHHTLAGPTPATSEPKGPCNWHLNSACSNCRPECQRMNSS